ncbi:hypothetical protein PIB30_079561 [Stylosanthes scabra]|uniref:Uncharacterized protein n=1 Tax=Stylosanthes scabra TaxID=79078 RepID=A0ABU6TRX8_9FABA|nr:hypothetical protein [Stylosanthes scabra]
MHTHQLAQGYRAVARVVRWHVQRRAAARWRQRASRMGYRDCMVVRWGLAGTHPGQRLPFVEPEIRATTRSGCYCAFGRSTTLAALTLHPHGRAGVGRVHPEMLLGTREVARRDRPTAWCPISHFLASSCEPFASNVFLILSYAFPNP